VSARDETPPQRFRGAGGTSGGVGEFCLGLAMTVVGAYLLLDQVTVSTGFWGLWGYNAVGLSLMPLLVGLGWLFFDGRAGIAWSLVVLSLLILLAGIVANLHVYFRPTSLFNTLIMLGLLAGGLGLLARSLRPH
jgi:hypothetical protein